MKTIDVKKIIKALKSPIIFYYVADEDLGKENSVFEKFFDEPKSTLISIIISPLATRLSVLTCCISFSKFSSKRNLMGWMFSSSIKVWFNCILSDKISCPNLELSILK